MLPDPDRIEPDIARRLRERREELGWSRQELAARIGTSADELGQFEEARKKIPPQRLIEAAQSMKTTLSWFLEGEPAKCRDSRVSPAGNELAHFLDMPEAPALVSAFAAISCPTRRQAVIDFAELEGRLGPRNPDA